MVNVLKTKFEIYVCLICAKVKPLHMVLGQQVLYYYFCNVIRMRLDS